MEDFDQIDPRQVGSGRSYEILSATIQPRPIALVSTVSAAGEPNLAPFSFFMPGGSNPASLAFSVTLGSGGRRKDTLRNIEETGEFVVNLVTRKLAASMNASSANLPPGESEWNVAGLESLPSEKVRPTRVASSPVHYECKAFQIVQHGGDAGAAVYVVGEVVLVHMARWLAEAESAALDTIARLGGPDYLDLATHERFSMQRP